MFYQFQFPLCPLLVPDIFSSFLNQALKRKRWNDQSTHMAFDPHHSKSTPLREGYLHSQLIPENPAKQEQV